MKELTLSALKHHSFAEHYQAFISLYKKLFFEDELSPDERNTVLSVVVLFCNQSEEVMRRLGYRMALLYGNKTNDFTPLYDLAINFGLIPIAALLRRVEGLPLNAQGRSESFMSAMLESYIDNFRAEGIVLTEQQFDLNGFFDSNLSGSATVVAPTSYGKSELIISAVKNSPNQRICILVPSKSLLAQTRKRVLQARIGWVARLVSHPEMHLPDDRSSVHILTQERLTRLLNQYRDMSFDIVVIDEAHNLLGNDARSTLLASVLRLLEHRNPNTAFKFLTPFLDDASSLHLRDSSSIPRSYKVGEYVKSELLYIADYRDGRSSLELYDHFTHEYVTLANRSGDPVAYLESNSADKNIVYFNRPKHIQQFALRLADALPLVDSQAIADAVAEIGANLDKQYLLLHCMKHGVLYHHGSMNEAVRNYVEYLYRECAEIRYIVSNSTLLEGVNLPAEKMFLMSVSRGQANLKPAHFKNLIGRVNRFSEIFSQPNARSLRKLQPEIHLVGTDDFSRRANLHTFYEKVMRVTRHDIDEIENVLLAGTALSESNMHEFKQAMTRLENLERGIAGDQDFPIAIATTEVGRRLLEGNISEIDIFHCESRISATLEEWTRSHSLVDDSSTLMGLIHDAFIAFIPDDQAGQRRSSLLRLKKEKARMFYAMYLDWTIENIPLPMMIKKMVSYWQGLAEGTPVYVGSWGDAPGDSGYGENFTYIKSKTNAERINLAIVRIKEEEDFFDHALFRFIEVLHDLNLLDETFYKRAKYGTADPKVISMINSGFSRGVSELLLTTYRRFVTLRDDGSVSVDSAIHHALKGDKVGFLQRHEVSLNVAEPPKARPVGV